ncbi:hypothetical protein [Streptomyces sp. NPDC101150]|uniref:hypothetical protein n=1 Tax=Streptomyces sp. NPDC101150 TaxID=3366114 RepID=UPI0038214002
MHAGRTQQLPEELTMARGKKLDMLTAEKNRRKSERTPQDVSQPDTSRPETPPTASK